MPAGIQHSELIEELKEAARQARSSRELMTRIVEGLHDRMLKYNWAGFYMLDPKDSGVLELGPFVGAMTPHTRIPLHQGICGAAASRGETVVVDDVNADPRYLACSLETKSEIVVPVFVKGRVVGELDIDSHFPAAFAAEDQELVQYCAAAVGRKLEKSAQ